MEVLSDMRGARSLLHYLLLDTPVPNFFCLVKVLVECVMLAATLALKSGTSLYSSISVLI